MHRGEQNLSCQRLRPDAVSKGEHVLLSEDVTYNGNLRTCGGKAEHFITVAGGDNIAFIKMLP